MGLRACTNISEPGAMSISLASIKTERMAAYTNAQVVSASTCEEVLRGLAAMRMRSHV